MLKAIHYLILEFRALSLRFKIDDLKKQLDCLEEGTEWYAALAPDLDKAKAKLVKVQQKIASF
jgi:hypothetical protein